MTQRGKLRTDVHRERWMKFRADQVVRPYSRSFSWDAKVRILPLFHVRVRDAYADGVGSGQVQLLSALNVASDKNNRENSIQVHFIAIWRKQLVSERAAAVRGRAVEFDRQPEDARHTD